MDRALFLLFYALAVFCGGCSQSTSPQATPAEASPPKVAVLVDDRKLTIDDLNQFFSSRIGEFTDHTDLDRVKSRLLEDFIEEQLLDRQALKVGIAASENDVQRYLQELESEKPKEPAGDGVSTGFRAEVTRTIRIQQFIQAHLGKGYEPDPADVQKYYNEHADEFSVLDRVQVQEILVSSADQAERILGQLRDAQYKNFAQMAKAYSIAPSSANGGDMGVFARGDLPEEMEKVFFNVLVPGKVQIIQTKYGYHLFLLMKRETAYKEPLVAVRQRILNLLREQHQKQLLADTVKQLRKEVPVVVYRENLDFSYNPSETPGGL